MLSNITFNKSLKFWQHSNQSKSKERKSTQEDNQEFYNTGFKPSVDNFPSYDGNSFKEDTYNATVCFNTSQLDKRKMEEETAMVLNAQQQEIHISMFDKIRLNQHENIVMNCIKNFTNNHTRMICTMFRFFTHKFISSSLSSWMIFFAVSYVLSNGKNISTYLFLKYPSNG